uniref:Uncharacterized protein n=1 Tax=Oryza punctata TaxID=4537 RepID=A0A0E0K6H7_ORYPU
MYPASADPASAATPATFQRVNDPIVLKLLSKLESRLDLHTTDIFFSNSGDVLFFSGARDTLDFGGGPYGLRSRVRWGWEGWEGEGEEEGVRRL